MLSWIEEGDLIRYVADNHVRTGIVQARETENSVLVSRGVRNSAERADRLNEVPEDDIWYKIE